MNLGARIGTGIGSMMVVVATCVVAGPAVATVHHPAAAGGVSEAFSGAASVPHSTDVWAFGATFTSGGGKILIAHQHKGHWTRRLIAEPADGSRLTGIVAASTSTVWLWGTNPSGGGVIWRLAGQQLKTVSVPAVVGKDEFGIQAIVGSSLTNVWIVGVDASGVKPLALHWNGKGWKNTPVPAGSGSYTEVRNIATSSPTNAVAYGQSDSGLPVWIWNGKKWRSASPGKLVHPTYAVATSGPTQSYLIGTTTGEISKPTSPQALYVLKWNGKKWSKTSAPSTHPVTVLSAVAVGKSAFVVGYRSSGGLELPIIARFTNGKWRYQKTPKVGGIGTQLRAVVASSPKAVTALGQSSTKTADPDEPDYHLLAETFNGHAWKLVKSLPK